MDRNDFPGVPEELVDHVVAYAVAIEAKGMTLTLEPFDVAFPRIPHFKGEREQTTVFYEVMSEIDWALVDGWSKFGKLSKTDTRFVVGFANAVGPDAGTMTKLGEMHIGLDWIRIDGVSTLTPPHDLAVAVELPTLPAQMVAPLADAYELFRQGNWKQGFEEACIKFQIEARDYLLSVLPQERIEFATPSGKAIDFDDAKVRRLTLGQLAKAFSQLVSPNLLETKVGECLSRIYANRNIAAHVRNESGQEQKLREEVGRNLLIAINGMKYLRGLD